MLALGSLTLSRCELASLGWKGARRAGNGLLVSAIAAALAFRSGPLRVRLEGEPRSAA